MPNNIYFVLTARFVILVLGQVLIFNKLNFFGFINPFIYIMWLYWYPVKQNRPILLLTSFLLGFTIDLFSDTLALHAAALTTAAYFRPAIMRFVFGVSYEFQNFRLGNATRAQQMTFLALLILLHHGVYFTLEVFSLTNVLLIFKKVMSIGIATLILSTLLASLFSTENNEEISLIIDYHHCWDCLFG
ncbi:MAG: rod shape-determining protein MreD [Flavobacteriaceae bacterium]